MGPLATGRADGQGIQVWISMQDGKSLDEMFTGKLKDSKEQGRGVLLMASGERYEGEFKDTRVNLRTARCTEAGYVFGLMALKLRGIGWMVKFMEYPKCKPMKAIV